MSKDWRKEFKDYIKGNTYTCPKENKRVVVPEGDRLDVEEQTSLVEYQQQQEEDSR